MKKTEFPIAALLLLVASSAVAQTPIVITNADLGKSAVQRIVMTPAQWQTFVAHQFTYTPPSRPDSGGGRVAVSGWTPPQAAAVARPTYPLQLPFVMSTYVGPTIGVVHLGPDGVTPRR